MSEVDIFVRAHEKKNIKIIFFYSWVLSFFILFFFGARKTRDEGTLQD